MTPRPPTPDRPAPRRAFTLLEIMLATVLGSLIVIATWSLFSTVNAADQRSRQRAADTIQLSNIHRVLSRAFQTIQTAERTRVISAQPTTANLAIPSSFEGSNPDEAAKRGRVPRVILAQEPERPGQRLEMVLAEAPIRGARLLRAGYDPSTNAVRGAFRLAPSTRGPRGSYDLVWEMYQPLESEHDTEAERSVSASRVIAEGLEDLRIRFWKSEPRSQELKPMMTAEVVLEADLPAYAEVAVRLASGRSVNWMFEIGWTPGPEPLAASAPGLIPPETDPAGGPSPAPGGGAAPGASARGPGDPRTAGRSSAEGGVSVPPESIAENRALEEIKRRREEELRVRDLPR
jgi:type II secretory pathway pseudopilin PulG